MAGLIRAVQIGVIAEAQNDVDVLYQLTCKVIAKNQFSFKRFLGHGCGKVRSKCKKWAENLLDRGCSHLVVLHDLDRRDANDLRNMLEEEIADIEFSYTVVLIPAEELEAWLLSDSKALKTVFKMRRLPKVPRWPQTIPNPKKVLDDVVRQNSNTKYLNTVHNRHIAEAISISKLDRCPSFSPYPEFLTNAFPRAALLGTRPHKNR